MSRESASVIALNPLQWGRSSDERQFLPAALEIIETPAFPVGRAIGGVILASVVVALAWACIGKVDIVATATGRLVPVGKTKVIQPFETGVVSAIRVTDGDHVKAGQVLMEVDPTQVLSGLLSKPTSTTRTLALCTLASVRK